MDQTLHHAYNFTPITKSDSVDIAPAPTVAIYVGGGGDVVCLNASGTAVTFSAVPTGTTLYIATKRVMSTNTTATLMVALF